MSVMLSAPETIPATRAGTFAAAVDPAGLATVSRAATSSCNLAFSARPITGSSPAVGTRLGSSKSAETL